MPGSPFVSWCDAEVSALAPFGWGDAVASRVAAVATPHTLPARVVRGDRSGYVVVTPEDTTSCHPSPHGAQAVVGDWVTVRSAEGRGLVLDAVADRHTVIRRRDPSEVGGQVLAANVDIVVLTVALDRPLNVSQVERLLVVVLDGGAVPVVALTKYDLAAPAEVEEALATTRRVAGADVVAVSALTDQGCDALRRFTGPGVTVALIGASGAGKSTLANRLIGDSYFATGPVREGDGKGRHTTTVRELVPLASGGVLIDTPGLRAVGLAPSRGGVAQVFEDIEDLGAACRFRNCRHTSEPGCAIRDALEAGELSERRYRSYQKIRREQAHVARREAQRERQMAARRARLARRASRDRDDWG